jgi:putative acetyltransferase
MTRDTLTIRPEPPRQPDVVRLLDDAEAQSALLYPVESRHHAGIDALERHQVRFFVARLDGEAVGTGGYLPDGAGQAELKRLFVAAEARGQGIARGILAALERAARNERVHLMQLETGVHSPEALALYRRAGYLERGPFGSYRPDPLSVFMEKPLEAARLIDAA